MLLPALLWLLLALLAVLALLSLVSYTFHYQRLVAWQISPDEGGAHPSAMSHSHPLNPIDQSAQPISPFHSTHQTFSPMISHRSEIPKQSITRQKRNQPKRSTHAPTSKQSTANRR
ncbi:hypothetical protein HOY82DRAFT_541417 [Tuber indicum]|nr:hypothetical protein HOY82DRAFT_541417 [Tuber indicum]